jgi:hypothetical protein
LALLGGGLAFKCHKPKCLRIFLTGDSIAQNVVVSGSALGSILPDIRNLSIAYTYICNILKLVQRL